jgi:hypothetical protein
MVYFQTKKTHNLGTFGKRLLLLWPFGIYYWHLVYCVAIRYFSGNLVYLVYCVKKNLATLLAVMNAT